MGAIHTSFGRIGCIDTGVSEASGDAPILFLHGVGSDKSVWKPQLDHLAATGRRGLAMDYPGYGDSNMVEGAGRDGYAIAAFALLDALGIEKAHVCGLSLGGVVCIAMAEIAPHRCASLIIADSFAVHPEGQAIHDRSVAASKAGPMRDLAEARAPSLLGEEARSSDAIVRDIIETMSGIDPAAYRQGAEAVWLADQAERARRIGNPTLVCVGDEDAITPPALSEELTRMIPGARMEMIDGAGHLANLEKPDAFNAMLDRWLAQQS